MNLREAVSIVFKRIGVKPEYIQECLDEVLIGKQSFRKLRINNKKEFLDRLERAVRFAISLSDEKDMEKVLKMLLNGKDFSNN